MMIYVNSIKTKARINIVRPDIPPTIRREILISIGTHERQVER